MEKLFALLGKNISYSFSRGYFTEKFKKSGLKDHRYINFDLPSIDDLTETLESHPNLVGFNVTIPYKEAVLPFLNQLDPTAAEIGAVNTVKVDSKGLTGYNTDTYGFRKSLEPHLNSEIKKGLILGTGGASKAVAYALKKLGITPTYVSRTAGENRITYNDLTKEVLSENLLIVNSTPLGTFPNVDQKPDIPYEFIGPAHLLYDLIYNPSETAFLKLGKEQGAQIANGAAMLEYQAEQAWEIWNRP